MSEWYSDSPYLQWSNQTRLNRFPKIFARARELKPDAKSIMSFGCSTGEECFTLAEVFPEAKILGVEANTWSLGRAKETNKTENVSFSDKPEGQFDLVTSFMVLFSMWTTIKLERWREVVNTIDQHIKPGGVWLIYTSQYPFKKAEFADNYEAIKQWTRIHPRDKKKYYCGYYRKKG